MRTGGRGSVISIDVGGTSVRAAAVGPTGKIMRRHRAATAGRDGGGAAGRVADDGEPFDQIVSAARRVAGSDAVAVDVVVGVPALVEHPGGRTLACPNVPGLADRDLADELSAELRTAVHVVNDADLWALGEQSFGAARECSSAFVLTLGSGIGSSYLRDAEVVRGVGGFSAEIAEWVVPAAPRGDGGWDVGVGTDRGLPAARLEDVASGKGIVARATRGRRAPVPTSTDEVAALADAGDRQCQEVLADAVGGLAAALRNVALLLYPERIVLGGGLARQERHLVGPLRAAFALLSRHDPSIRCELAPSVLGERAPLLGGLRIALRR
jgi:glucokinase